MESNVTARFTFTFVENKQLHKSDKPVNYSRVQSIVNFNLEIVNRYTNYFPQFSSKFTFFVFLVILKNYFLQRTAAAKYDMVHSHKAGTDLATTRQVNQSQTFRLIATNPLGSLPGHSGVSSLRKYWIIPLLFTSKLEFNLPAKFARHPKWRLNVDG